MEQPKPVPPSKDPKWRVQISFKEKGMSSLDEKVFAFEVKEQCVVLIKHDRWDKNGMPHVHLRIFPLAEIRKASVIEIDRPKPPSPSPIIHPRTGEAVKTVN